MAGKTEESLAFSASMMDVDASAFAKLAEQEPILGELLGLATQVSNGHATLSLEPWLEGSVNYEGAMYRSGGIFYRGANGEALFRFVLQNVEDGSSLSYTGRLSDAGRQVSYSYTRRDKNGRPLAQGKPVEWRLAGAAPSIERAFSPTSPAPTMEVDAATFTRLGEKELILGELLETHTQQANGRATLSLEPWLEGFVKYEGAIYRSSGVFYPKAPGEALFRFVLQNVEDGSSLSYTGRLSDAGRQISYSTTKRDKSGKPLVHSGSIEWRLGK